MRRHETFDPGTDCDSAPGTPRVESQRITRPKRVPTPKMSDRKKALFGDKMRTLRESSAATMEEEEEDSDLGPMSPLKFSNSPKRAPMKAMNITSFRNILGNASPDSDRSLSPDFERRFSRSEQYEILPASHDKENHMHDEETLLSFPSGTPRMRPVAVESVMRDESNSNSLSLLMSSDLNIVDKRGHLLQTPGLSAASTQNSERKPSFRKLSFQDSVLTPSGDNISGPSAAVGSESKARTSLSFSEIRPISTKSFYSSASNENAISKPTPKPAPSVSSGCFGRVPSRRNLSSQRKRPSAKTRGNSIRLGNIKRGVFHKIKKPSTKAKAVVKKLSTSQILNSTSSMLNTSVEKLEKSKSTPPTPRGKSKSTPTTPLGKIKSTPTTPVEPQLQQQINRIRKILLSTKNSIEQAKPLKLSKSMTDLSSPFKHNGAGADSGSEEDDDDRCSTHNGSTFNGGDSDRSEESENDDDAKSEGTARKFFKSSSSRRIKREYKVINNVSATVRKGGKISLNQVKPKKRKYKSMFDEDFDFESEQLEVDDIISKLNFSQVETNKLTSCKKTTPLNFQSTVQPTLQPEPKTIQIEIIDALHSEISNDEPIPVQSSVIFVDRLSPLLGQSSEDSSSREVAMEQQACIQNEYYQSPMTQIRTMTSGLTITKAANVSDQLHCMPSPIPNDRLFPIFYKDHQRIVAETEGAKQEACLGLFDPTRRRQKRLRSWRPIGSNQYQIDAGQKEYGAQTCSECGLVYSVHEPEEELIHANYHNSRHVLKFGGWSNEAVVAHVPQWDVTGRILVVSMTEAMHKLQKVQEVLEVVDRELGYVEHCQLQKGSMVYLAVARSVILGVCVAQPLQQANRLLTIEGTQGSIDCCTMEAYPAKCGISRIWVSPSFRGNGIARTLLTVVQSNFIFGYPMCYDEIAFSAPTEAGKRLAESLTGRKDFLIYM